MRRLTTLTLAFLTTLGLTSTAQAITPDRLVPVRFVHLIPGVTGCGTGARCTPSQSSMNLVTRDSIDNANVIFQPSGIKFWIKSEELIGAPTLSTGDDSTPVSFSTVKAELQRIFPSMPSNAFFDWETKTAYTWLRAAAVFYADPNELLAYVVPGTQTKSLTDFPEDGRSTMLRGAYIVTTPFTGVSTQIVASHVAHELGHYFGPRHVFSPVAGTNPATGDAWESRDFWDLYYCQFNEGTFFATQADFDSWYLSCTTFGNLGLINDSNYACNATVDPWRAEPECSLQTQDGTFVFAGSDPDIRGIFRSTGLPHDPPTSYGYEANVMGYWGTDDNSYDMDKRAPSFFSDSQLAMMDAYLQYESLIDQTHLNSYYSLGVYVPAGASPLYDLGLRTYVGTVNDDSFVHFSNSRRGVGMNFTFTAQPVSVPGSQFKPVTGDFDGDGYSDILFYDPSSTTALFWWGSSTRTFTQDSRTGFFPETGYQVFTGDFDGNHRSDLFLYKPGGNSRIRWTTSGRTFTTTSTDYPLTISGTYTPLVGNFDGDTGARDDIFWYSPSGGFVNRWFMTGSNGTFTHAGYNGVAVPSGGPFRAFVGDFDGNGSADVFWYQPGGTVSERLWWGPQTGSSAPVGVTSNVSGDYQPIVGDFDGDGKSDILWDTQGSATDFIWAGATPAGQFDHGGTYGSGATHSGRISVYGTFKAVVGDFDHDLAADILWYRQ